LLLFSFFLFYLVSSVLALTYDNFMTLIATNVLVSGYSVCISVSLFRLQVHSARAPHKSKV